MNNFRPARNIEQRFAADILDMLRHFFSPVTPPNAEELRGGQNARLLRPDEWLVRYAQQAAQRMVGSVLTNGAKEWRLAARESMGGPKIYTALRQELRGPVGRRARELALQNAQLVRSLPLEIAELVTRRVQRNYEAGERAEAYERLIPRVSRWKAKLIARTETSKASTALTRARSESLGLNWYVWRTSIDQRVRPAHKLMNSVLIAFTDAPSPEQLYGIRSTLGHYNAGDAPNCRCYPEPLIHLTQVSWPHKVYYANRIQTLTLASFRNLVHLPAILQLKEAA